MIFFPPFSVGQQVRALQSIKNPFCLVVKGQVYTVIGVVRTRCQCNAWIVNLGFKSKGEMWCFTCDTPLPDLTGYIWLWADLFAPLPHQFEDVPAFEVVNAYYFNLS